MKNIKVILGILLIFLLGVASGAVMTHLLYTSRIEGIMSGRPETREEMLVKRLSRKLDLDNRQREQVRSIVSETHAEMKRVRSQFHPQIEAILAKSQEKITTVLTPEQQEKFTRIIAERKARRVKGD